MYIGYGIFQCVAAVHLLLLHLYIIQQYVCVTVQSGLSSTRRELLEFQIGIGFIGILYSYSAVD